MGKRLNITDEERLQRRRAHQREYNKKRNSPVVLIRQSEKEERMRLDAGAEPQPQVNKAKRGKYNKMCHEKMKERRSIINKRYRDKQKLLDKYKQMYGKNLITDLNRHNHLQIKEINGELKAHLTPLGQSLVSAAAAATLFPPFNPNYAYMNLEQQQWQMMYHHHHIYNHSHARHWIYTTTNIIYHTGQFLLGTFNNYYKSSEMAASPLGSTKNVSTPKNDTPDIEPKKPALQTKKKPTTAASPAASNDNVMIVKNEEYGYETDEDDHFFAMRNAKVKKEELSDEDIDDEGKNHQKQYATVPSPVMSASLSKGDFDADTDEDISPDPVHSAQVKEDVYEQDTDDENDGELMSSHF